MKKVILLCLAVFTLLQMNAQSLAKEQLNAKFSRTTTKGETINMDALRGKVVIMMFWKTTNEDSQAAFPEIREMSNWYQDEGDNVIFLAPTPENKGIVDEYVNGQSGNLQIMPEATDLVQKYNISTFPSFLVFDQAGKNSLNGRSLISANKIKGQIYLKIEELQGKSE